MGLEEQKECIDPKYQRDKGIDTYYPQGTLCFKDPSAGIIVFNAVLWRTRHSWFSRCQWSCFELYNLSIKRRQHPPLITNPCFTLYTFSESCPDFGSSGSGIVRAWAKRNDKKSFTVDKSTYSSGLTTYSQVTQYQYSFVGPLSMQKVILFGL